MQYFFLTILIFSIYTQAITLNIKNDNNITVYPQEIDFQIENAYKKYGIRPTKEAAKKRIQENRTLANLYIKKYGIPLHLLLQTKLQIEETLADKYIKKEQEKINLSDTILKSYYIMHKKEFIHPESVEAIIKRFKNYERAEKFYNNCKNTNKPNSFLKNEKSQELFINKIHPAIRPLFKVTKTNQCIPPVYLGKDFLVFIILKKKKEKLLSFPEVKNKIRKILLKKAYNTTREKLLIKNYK